VISIPWATSVCVKVRYSRQARTKPHPFSTVIPATRWGGHRFLASCFLPPGSGYDDPDAAFAIGREGPVADGHPVTL
jgi:hypothetical protein